MKFRDMMEMSLKNLWQRKTRTILTVLGVVIGVAAIVVMISLGLGLRSSMMEQIEGYSNGMQIRVTTPYNSSANTKSAEEKLLSDSTAEEFQTLEHVEHVYKDLEINIIQKFGQYYCSNTLTGLDIGAIEGMKLNLQAGAIPEEGEELSIIYGNTALNGYYNIHNNAYPYYDNGEPLEVDLMSAPVPTYFDTDAFYSTIGAQSGGSYGGDDGTGGSTAAPRKYQVKTAGVLAGGPEDYYSMASWNLYCDVEALKSELKKAFRNRAIPGQPVKKNGRPYKEIYYTALLVEVDDFRNVQSVQRVLTDMGYNAESDADWIRQQQQSINMIQAVLGGIGAVSLLVAAIGIANTMMMSIYERIKEIGIMKVIGCNIRDIGALFLIEAAYIGFFGGMVGLVFSYIVSGLINHFAAGSLDLGMGMMEGGARISTIPPWLAAAGVLFAILIGMISGFVPSQRAMRLSALAAIKNE